MWAVRLSKAHPIRTVGSVRIASVLLRRLVAGVLTVWATLSVMFALFAFTDDWNLSRILATLRASPGAGEREAEQFREEYLAGRRDFGDNLVREYLEFMTDMFLLRWQESAQTGESVLELTVGAALRTGAYVLPATILAVGLALTVGAYAALRPGTTREQTVRLLAYIGLGVPSFWLGVFLLVWADDVAFTFSGPSDVIQAAPLPFVYEWIAPVVLVAITLVAAIASYARSQSLEYINRDAARLIRAKGGSRLDVIRHVLKNAAIPLVSLTFTETLALLALSVFVIEAVFAIEGIGLVFYNAVWAYDIPVVTGATMMIVTLGVLGNSIQDLLYTVLDPRVDTESR